MGKLIYNLSECAFKMLLQVGHLPCKQQTRVQSQPSHLVTWVHQEYSIRCSVRSNFWVALVIAKNNPKNKLNAPFLPLRVGDLILAGMLLTCAILLYLKWVYAQEHETWIKTSSNSFFALKTQRQKSYCYQSLSALIQILMNRMYPWRTKACIDGLLWNKKGYPPSLHCGWADSLGDTWLG